MHLPSPFSAGASRPADRKSPGKRASFIASTLSSTRSQSSMKSSGSESACPRSPHLPPPPGPAQYPAGADGAQTIDVDALRTSLDERIAYLTDFQGFTSEDTEVLARVRPLVLELIPELVEKLFEKLFEFDITKRTFMSRTNGFEGPLPRTLAELTMDSPHITFRKHLLTSWARRVLTADYTSNKTWQYMDSVGIMHAGTSPFKHQRTMGIPPFVVPYRDCAMLLGWVQQVIQTAILRVEEERCPLDEKIAAVAAVGKVIWIQNDLFARHKIQE